MSQFLFLKKTLNVIILVTYKHDLCYGMFECIFVFVNKHYISKEICVGLFQFKLGSTLGSHSHEKNCRRPLVFFEGWCKIICMGAILENLWHDLSTNLN